MLALLLMLGCADAPIVDSGEPEPEWLYGTEVAECSGETHGAIVPLPDADGLRIDVWVCQQYDQPDGWCEPGEEMEWYINDHERGLIVNCDLSGLSPEGAFVQVDWSAPNPAW